MMNDSEAVNVVINLDRDEYEALEALARRHGVSVASFVERLATASIGIARVFVDLPRRLRG